MRRYIECYKKLEGKELGTAIRFWYEDSRPIILDPIRSKTPATHIIVNRGPQRATKPIAAGVTVGEIKVREVVVIPDKAGYIANLEARGYMIKT